MCTCKKCGSNSCRKNGIPNGKQRYKCKICGLNFIQGDKRQENATSEDIKKQALNLYLSGLSLRRIGFLLGFSNVSILNWIREFGEKQAIAKKTISENQKASEKITTVNEANLPSKTLKKKLLK
jgi:transposase-like protein